jgi:hypothetical protein
MPPPRLHDDAYGPRIQGQDSSSDDYTPFDGGAGRLGRGYRDWPILQDVSCFTVKTASLVSFLNYSRPSRRPSGKVLRIDRLDGLAER